MFFVVAAGLFCFSTLLFSGLLVAVSCYKVEALCGGVVRCCCAVFVGFLLGGFVPMQELFPIFTRLFGLLRLSFIKSFIKKKKKKKKKYFYSI